MILMFNKITGNDYTNVCLQADVSYRPVELHPHIFSMLAQILLDNTIIVETA